MNDFKWRHFKGDIILGCVRWYCKYGISYRELKEMMEERGVRVDHTTLYRWVQKYAPEIQKRLKWYSQPQLGASLRVDETYIKVKGKWVYLYRALDQYGNTIDFYLSQKRNVAAAKRFLAKTLRCFKHGDNPTRINTDKAPAYGVAIRELKDEGKCSQSIRHSQIKYLNNRLESDHGKLKRLINPTLGFQSMKTAYATIKGFEVMRMIKKGQFDIWMRAKTVVEEVRLIYTKFGIYTV